MSGQARSWLGVGFALGILWTESGARAAPPVRAEAELMLSVEGADAQDLLQLLQSAKVPEQPRKGAKVWVETRPGACVVHTYMPARKAVPPRMMDAIPVPGADSWFPGEMEPVDVSRWPVPPAPLLGPRIEKQWRSPHGGLLLSCSPGSPTPACRLRKAQSAALAPDDSAELFSMMPAAADGDGRVRQAALGADNALRCVRGDAGETRCMVHVFESCCGAWQRDEGWFLFTGPLAEAVPDMIIEEKSASAAPRVHELPSKTYVSKAGTLRIFCDRRSSEPGVHPLTCKASFRLSP